MDFIYFTAVALLFQTVGTEAANDALRLDNLEKNFESFRSLLESISRRVSLLQDKLNGLDDKVSKLYKDNAICADENLKEAIPTQETARVPSGIKTEQMPVCQLFKGSVCTTHIGYKSIAITSKDDQAVTEEKVIASLSVMGNSNGLSDQCVKYLISAICHFSFPQCDGSFHLRRMCRDECEMLEKSICVNEFKLAKDHPLIDNSVIPRCNELPQHNTDCIRIGVPVQGYDDKCYHDNGADYKGQTYRTKSGIECRNWNYNPDFPIELPEFSDILGDHNQCRNPNGTMVGPWCYTDINFSVKELCDVPVCAPVPSGMDMEQLPVCQLFKDSVCSTHIGNKSIVITSKDAHAVTEEKVIAALSVVSNSNGLSDQCVKYLKSAICHFSFPQCDGSFHLRRLCREECEILEKSICVKEFKAAKDHPLIDSSVIPRCNELPQHSTDCIRIGVSVQGYADEEHAEPLLPPVGLKATVGSNHSIDLKWTDPSLDSTQTITDNIRYIIRYTSIPKQQKYLKVITRFTYHRVARLQSYTTYEFSVRVSKGGMKSQWSVPVQNTTCVNSRFPVSPPRNVRVTSPDQESIIVEWEEPNIPIAVEGYRVVFTSVIESPVNLWQKQEVAGNTRTVTIRSLKPKTTYHVSVLAVSAHGQGPMSELVKVLTLEEGSVSYPKNLTVVSLDDDPTLVSVSWLPLQTRTPITAGYLIFYTTNTSLDDTYWNVEGVIGEKSSLRIKDLAPGETYYFKVQARTDKGYGPMSPFVKYVPAAHRVPISPPRNVRVTTPDQESMIVEWEEPNIPAVIEGYRVIFTSRTDYPLNLWQKQEVTGNTRTVTIRSLKPKTTYHVIVSAFSDHGEGPMAEIVKVLTLEEGQILDSSLTPPVMLSAVSIYGHTVNVTWTDPSLDYKKGITDNRYYTIRYMPLSRYGYAYESEKCTCLAKQILTLNPGTCTEYEFSVRVSNGRRTSLWSRKVINTDPETYPQNVIVKRVDSNPSTVVVTWDPPQSVVKPVEEYFVSYTTDASLDDELWSVDHVDGEKLSVRINDLTPGATYYFKIDARYDRGYSPFSHTITYEHPK